jgi:DNA-binding beta-propeller fold protein YncE
MRLIRNILLLAISALMAATLSWSAKKIDPQPVQNLVWPNPPEAPRVRYLGEHRGSVDFARKPSKWRRFLVGAESTAGVNLHKPYGVTTDTEGRVYVTDTGLGAVLVFDPEKRSVTTLGKDGPVRLVTPIGLAVDEKGRLFVSDVDLDQVFCFDLGEQVVLALGRQEGMKNPTGIAIDKARHRLYVADSHQHKILIYSTDGQFLESWGSRGPEGMQFNFPTNVTVDDDGNVYVVDTGNFRVQVISPAGKLQSSFGEVGNAMGNFHRPKGIGVDSEGHIYVADAAFNNFQIFDPTGELLLYVGTTGREPGSFWLPAGVHIDEQDRIFVVDQINRRVQVFQYLAQERDKDEQ